MLNTRRIFLSGVRTMTQHRLDSSRLRALRETRGLTQQEVAEGLARLAWAHDRCAVGVNADMVSKWERADKQPSRLYRRLICLLFDVDPAEIGLAVQLPAGATCGTVALPGVGVIEHLDKEASLLKPALASMWKEYLLRRRSMLKLLGLAPLALLPEAVVEPGPADELRLSTVSVAALEALAEKYQRLYLVTDPSELLIPVLAHLRTASGLLSESASSSLRQRLLSNYGAVSLLAGRLSFFDLGDPPAARGHLTTALDAARESGDRVLAAAALGHASFVPAAEKNYAAAGDYLRGANSAAAKADAPALRSWLAAVEAELSTHAGARKTALAALDRAEVEIEESAPHPMPAWFDYYDQSRLDGFRGYSYQAFGKLEAAQSCLEGAVAALPERCAKQRSVVLTDLATVHLQNGEVEEACRTAGTAVQALQRAGYATGTHRLREFRSHVEPWKGQRAVRMLDDQMSAI